MEVNCAYHSAAFDNHCGHGRYLFLQGSCPRSAPRFFIPTAFVAMLYGSVLSMIFAIDATFVVGMLLYDANIFVSEPRQAGELFLFALTALIGAKCTAELAGQPERSF